MKPQSKDQNQKSSYANGHDSRPVLITGGCGFIGTNLAHRYLSHGQKVILFDNLSRPGVEKNLHWLQEIHGSALGVEVSDVRNCDALRKVVRDVSKVFHFAAQVAVTTSLVDPINDFEVNARGTLNLLEALRHLNQPPPLIFTSSNKVYGDLAGVRLKDDGCRYCPVDGRIHKHGFSENRPLNFHSPYGCSKGAGGQYVLDYARTFRLPAIVFHMSCIYGLHQFGNEDQGWVAHFLIRALENRPITIYGDGKQVRDILFIDDLVDAFLVAQQHMQTLAGSSFNIGGGTEHTISLLELLHYIEALHGETPQIIFEETRAADQPYYVSDIRKFSFSTGWKPRVRVNEGIRRLYNWLIENHDGAIRASHRRTTEVRLSHGKHSVPNGSAYKTAIAPRSGRLWREQTTLKDKDL